MPDRHSCRWRRRVGWAGLVACVALAILTVATTAFDAAIYRYTSTDIRWISIRGSAINVHRVADPYALPPAESAADWQTTAGGSFDWSFTALPSVSSTASEFNLTVPLWIVLVVVAVGTVLMFLTDRRRPTGCTNCNYDLSGLPAGSCPECGRRFTRPAEQTRK